MEDVELPDYLHDLDADEMIKWLSFGQDYSCSQFDKTQAPIRASSKKQAMLLVSKFLEQVEFRDDMDKHVWDFVVGNLSNFANGGSIFEVGKGQVPLEFEDMRWRSWAMRVTWEAGAKQVEIAELLGVSIRLVSSSIKFTKGREICDEPIWNKMIELAGEYFERQDYRSVLLNIDSYRELKR
ncbi:hypothetical protein [Vibrio penaeicida]|uniref:XRE family transcriptional regulator n=1 Tax=Vibrio penaeicida TaxID=104609 RepID=A0AAV5NL60_9VIBR|nr:hypothetical protein [Vibrio penaeicida]RTZ23366.1 hypothetical protein EKN09_09245 [Vibrio penaeicida]GLQ71361.1 hypothetical protein GCM10007932_07210 [Vibrio penaeicida]